MSGSPDQSGSAACGDRPDTGPVGSVFSSFGLYRSLALLAVGAGVALWGWRYSHTALQDVVLWGAFAVALYNYRKTLDVWNTAAGYVVLAVAIFCVIHVPLGVDPASSVSTLWKYADFGAFGLAVPLLLGTRSRLATAFLCAAAALTLVLGYDLIRLVWTYGGAVAEQARFDPSPVIVHANVAAMACGLACIILVHTAWQNRRSRPALILAVVCLAINLAYMLLMRSRAAQLGVVVAMGAGVVLLMGNWRLRLAVILLGLACLAGLVASNPRFRGAGVLGGLVDRDKVWGRTVHLISERPWFGHGAGEQVFMKTYHTADAPPSSQRFYHPHQYWLGMLFAYGVVGAALQVVMWVMLSVALMRRAVAGPDDGGRGMAAMVLSLIVFLQFVGLVDCLPGVVGLAAILTVPAALVATRVKAA